MSQSATFDEHDHCVRPGWATYHRYPLRRFRLRCWLGWHVLPPSPAKATGYSPSNYRRCARCTAHMHWFVQGQHRYGSYDRETARAYTARTVR